MKLADIVAAQAVEITVAKTEESLYQEILGIAEPSAPFDEWDHKFMREMASLTYSEYKDSRRVMDWTMKPFYVNGAITGNRCERHFSRKPGDSDYLETIAGEKLVSRANTSIFE